MPPSIAIVGAGPTGLALALALHQHTPCTLTVYEARATPLDVHGAVTLTPNALRVLDALAVLSPIQQHSYEYTELVFRNHADAIVDTYPFGSTATYGYPALRTYRSVLLRALLDAVEAAGISVVCGKKFARVVDETPDAVTWEFADGSTGTAARLIGADGIHSRVRKHLYPALEPAFAGAAAITARIPRAQLQVDDAYALPATIMHPVHGAYIIAPQQPDGSEMLIGKQLRLGDRDRAGWEAYHQDLPALVAFLRDGAHEFPAVVGHAVAELDPAAVSVWPFYQVPRLERWASPLGRVVVLGDAAHAILPTAGQGVNQALEDALTFAMVVARGGGLEVWQAGRQERVDRVCRLNEELNERRLPGWKGDVGGGFDLAWLYGVRFDEMVEGWFKG